MTIEIQNAEYRPCFVDGRKALFHRWAEKQQGILKFTNVCSAEVIAEIKRQYKTNGIVPPNCEIETVIACLGIVEFEDGAVAEVEPSKIRFVTGKCKEYNFNEIKE
jgi:hypothetical protein